MYYRNRSATQQLFSLLSAILICFGFLFILFRIPEFKSDRNHINDGLKNEIFMNFIFQKEIEPSKNKKAIIDSNDEAPKRLTKTEHLQKIRQQKIDFVSPPVSEKSVELSELNQPNEAAILANEARSESLNIDSKALVKAFQDSKTEIQKMAERSGKSLSAPQETKYDQFQVAAKEAAIPQCTDADAMKHVPPLLGPVKLGGLLAIPDWIRAGVTGKCK
jgi:hypothetical protein